MPAAHGCEYPFFATVLYAGKLGVGGTRALALSIRRRRSVASIKPSLLCGDALHATDLFSSIARAHVATQKNVKNKGK